MKRRLGVYLGEHPQLVGHLHYNRDGARESAMFEYDNAWLSAPATFPIEPALPLVRGPQFHKAFKDGSVFHPAIADTEPDGWGMTVIRRDHAKRRAAARAAGEDLPPLDGALEYLLSVDDACRIGALRFQDEAGEFWRPAATDGHRTTPPLLELGAGFQPDLSGRESSSPTRICRGARRRVRRDRVRTQRRLWVLRQLNGEQRRSAHRHRCNGDGSVERERFRQRLRHQCRLRRFRNERNRDRGGRRSW